MRTIKKLLVAVVISLVFCGATPVSPVSPVLKVVAHSGRTDSNGGHRDNKNKSGLGSYHYHCGGHPAHLHKNGVCPYAGSSVSTTKSTGTSKSTNASESTNAVPNTTINGSQSSAALKVKYKAYTDDYDNKLKTGYFRQDVKIAVYGFIGNAENAAYLQSLLTAEEVTDLTVGNDAVRSEILSKLLYARVYEVISQQMMQQEQAALLNSGTEEGTVTDSQTSEAEQNQDAFLLNLVTQVQLQLRALGFYSGEVDGIFDVETQQALINFQTAFGLSPDGTINEQVIVALSINI